MVRIQPLPDILSLLHTCDKLNIYPVSALHQELLLKLSIVYSLLTIFDVNMREIIPSFCVLLE